MQKALLLLVYRALTLVAFSTSVALWIDYSVESPPFCGGAGGCAALRQSGLGYLPLGAGLPLPALGALAFFLLLVSSLGPRSVRSRVALTLGITTGVVALLLLALQALLGVFCSLCVVVDLCGVGIGVAVLGLRRAGFESTQDEEERVEQIVSSSELSSEARSIRGVWRDDSRVYEAPTPLVRPPERSLFLLKKRGYVGLLFLGALLPLSYPQVVRQSSAPDSVRSLFVPDRVNVVEFFDFECPHCRHLVPRMDRIAADYGTRVHLVRRHVPLPSHPNAERAARVALCAGEQGQEEAVTQVLLAAPDLTDSGISSALKSLPLDSAKLASCLSSNRPARRLAEDLSRIQKAGFEGLPTTYIEGYRVVGAYDDALYRGHIEQALRGEDQRGLTPLAFGALSLLLVALAVRLGWRPKNPA